MHDRLEGEEVPPRAANELVARSQHAVHNTALDAALILVRVVQLFGAVLLLNKIVEVISVADLLAAAPWAVCKATKIAAAESASKASTR